MGAAAQTLCSLRFFSTSSTRDLYGWWVSKGYGFFTLVSSWDLLGAYEITAQHTLDDITADFPFSPPQADS